MLLEALYQPASGKTRPFGQVFGYDDPSHKPDRSVKMARILRFVGGNVDWMSVAWSARDRDSFGNDRGGEFVTLVGLSGSARVGSKPIIGRILRSVGMSCRRRRAFPVLRLISVA
jgi:hypothetical protein